MANVICVFGSPNVGSTTLSIAIAREFAKTKKNVALLCTDENTPTIPVIFPQSTKQVGAKDTRSIGKILSGVNVSSNDILKQMITVPKLNNLAILGYAYGENSTTYPSVLENDVYLFYQKLADLVDIIIVDCSSNINNLLSKIALQNADSIIRCCSCDFKSISYFASNLNLVSTAAVSTANHIVVYPCLHDFDDVNEVASMLGEPDYEMKYSTDIDKMDKNGEYLLIDFPSHYKKVVSKIVKEMNLIG